MTEETRPPIETITTGAELRRWYWMKDELVARARAVGVKMSGGKFTILDRLAHYLDTGETVWPGDKRTKVASTFDWANEVLTPETIITDSYKNGPNVRRFFQTHASPTFKFHMAFMRWMKDNTGKTLGDAVEAWRRMEVERKSDGFQSDIADHNQFNQYTRDFLADNPDLGIADVRRVWALKRALPSEDGRHRYEPSDLNLK
ncbi:MAG: DUF6434 domain-containing protein [Pseudomonadota bacterium]